MKNMKKMNAWEILSVAVRSEEDAAGFYAGIRKRVKNELLIDKLDFLIREEGRHKVMLERLFAKKFPDKPNIFPPGAALPEISGTLSNESPVVDLFQTALKAEKTAEDFYMDAAKGIKDEESRHILAYLGRVERSHQAMIKAEIDLLEKFPEYYNVEDFHLGQDLFHIGP